MTREMKKSNIRTSAEDYRRLTDAARRAGMSTNRYLVVAGLAYAADQDQTEQIKALIDARLAQQNEAVVSVLTRLDAAHAEQDHALRDSLRGALEKVLRAVNDPEVRAAIRSADPLNKEPAK